MFAVFFFYKLFFGPFIKNPSNMNETDLLDACANNNVAGVAQLLARSVNVNAYSLLSHGVAGKLQWPSQVATFPLEIAAHHNYVALAKLLLAHDNVDTEQTDFNGETALFTACKRNHPAVAALLVKHTPSLVNITTYTYSTPLLVSVQFGNIECTQLLLKQPLINVNFPRILQRRQRNGFSLVHAVSPLEHCVHTQNMQALHLLLARPDIKIDHALIAATCTYNMANAACIMLVKKHRLLSPVKQWCKRLMRKTLPHTINELVHVFTTPQTRMKHPLACSRLFAALSSSLLTNRDVRVLLKTNVLQITNFRSTELASFASLKAANIGAKAAYVKCVTVGWAPCRHALYSHARFRCVARLLMLLHHRSYAALCEELWLHILRFVDPEDGAAPALDAAGKRRSVLDLQ